MARAFDHHLHVFLPGLLGQFTEDFQLRELCFVARVRQASRAHTIAERKAHIMLLENLDNFVKAFVKKVLFLVMLHPVRHQRTAARDDSGDALAYQWYMFPQHAGVDGHIVHALLGLFFNHFEHQVERQIFRAPNSRNRFINRNGSDRHGRGIDDGFANFWNISAGGKIHDVSAP